MRLPGLGGFGVVELGERAVRGFFGDRMATHAAALAYRGLFGLFPFLLLMFMLLGVLEFDASLQGSPERVGPGF